LSIYDQLTSGSSCLTWSSGASDPAFGAAGVADARLFTAISVTLSTDRRALTLPLREGLLLHWLLLHLLPLLLRHTHHALHSLTHHHLLLHLLELLRVESTIHHPHIRLWDLHIEVK
jgi:hypothetical protein